MSEAAQTLTVVIPLQIKLRGGRKTMVTNGVMALEAQQDITLIKAVARAFRWRGMLESGAFATINELAAAEKINPSYVSRVLRLTLLAPEMVEAILDGRQPEGVTLRGLLEGVPVGWGEQRSLVDIQCSVENASASDVR
ncbi:MAG: hypothetical protein ACK530_01985 [Alphaproteobacteria bacterium]